MKYLLLLILPLLAVTSCRNDSVTIPKAQYDTLVKATPPPPPPAYPKQTYANFTFDDYQNNWTIVMVDSCEYLYRWIGDHHGGAVMTHRGRCKFCLQRNAR